jgi:glycosyltransferase involved in cell wall biosynthesis
MRIVLVGPYPADPGRVAGGVESAFVNLVDGLASFSDLELAVVTFDRGADRSRRVDGPPARVEYLAARERLVNLTLYRGDRRLLRQALDELAPDVVHAQDTLGYGYVSLRVARREPVVVSIHGIVRETRKLVQRPRDRLQVTVAGVWLERYCVRNAKYLVQPTRYPEEYFDGELRGRIVDVGNAVSDAFFAVEPAPVRGRVLFVGGVTDGKRVLDLVEAIARVRVAAPDVTLRVAGPPSEPYAQRVAERIAELGLGDCAALLGPLSTEQLLEEYRLASVFVLPSAQETSPMVIAEAMAAGVPVVATRVGGVPYLVDHGATGLLVDVGDLDALADRIAALVGDDDLRRAFGRTARSRASERYRPVEVAARVRAVYEEAAG